ncbi:unannotated protein [freshwater metagenome]|uniref:Unannotated protein n=1 Tax=freshwater metagenome TaxID=449393 RepID=A0A6J7D2D4_9ZZZZ
MVGVLREAQARVDDERIALDAGFECRSDALADLGHDLADDIGVVGQPGHAGALTAPVHHHVGHCQRRDRAIHLVIGQPAAHVVDDAGSRPNGRLRRARSHRVDAHRDPGRHQALDHREHPRLLLIGADPRCAGSSRLPADIDDVSASSPHSDAVGNGLARREVDPAVGKRVGCHIEDAHDQGSVSPRERRGQARQGHRTSLSGPG